MPTLTEMIYSNDYADLILSNYQVNLEEIQNLDPEIGKTLYASQQYSILYYQRRNLPENQFDVLPYNVGPCLYTPPRTPPPWKLPASCSFRISLCLILPVRAY